MTDEDVLTLIKGDTPLNRARRQFSSWSAKIEQAGQQRKPISPIDMRRMEFKAVEAIVKELGFDIKQASVT
jgi:hypothetical protein